MTDSSIGQPPAAPERKPGKVDGRRLRSERTRRLIVEAYTDLVREHLITAVAGPPAGYEYNSKSVAQDQMIAAVDATYRREVVRVATLIHSRTPSSLRDFARAFRFKSDKD